MDNTDINKSMMVNHPKLELVELTVFLEFRVYGYFVEFGSTGETWRQKEMQQHLPKTEEGDFMPSYFFLSVPPTA